MKQCPKCEGAMEAGWSGTLYQTANPLIWYRGIRERGWLGGAMRPGRSDRLDLIAHRCKECGFVEFYSQPLRVE